MPLFQIPGSGLFRPDSLSWVMSGLVLLVVTIVRLFSRRYLAGDRQYRNHRTYVLLLSACMIALVCTDHLLVLLASWAASNLLLVKLMVHKGEWTSARNSGRLALKTFGLGLVSLGAGFWLLANSAGTASISDIVQNPAPATTSRLIALLLIAVAAITQSAAWPFHRWLTSSLNSPTPVSALMHAGLVNGGGFLLVRFAPLIATHSVLMLGLFAVGVVTAIVGSFWKLLQTDIKRMLACSTMGQMGFMLMQCGMGLFAPAVSHLCWHGLFKAYLFLSAGSVIREKRPDAARGSLAVTGIVLCCLVGAAGSLSFSAVSGVGIDASHTGFLMVTLAFMSAAQVAAGLLGRRSTGWGIVSALAAGVVAGGLYGASVRVVEVILAPLHLDQPQPMNAFYLAGISLIVLTWLALNLSVPAKLQSLAIWKRVYMAALNSSQPHPSTITATRTAYQS